jgi:hypothetical protein
MRAEEFQAIADFYPKCYVSLCCIVQEKELRMSSEQQVIDQCEALWKSTEKGEPARSVEADRQREGTYTNGFRNDIKTWEARHGDYIVRAKRVQWRTFNLAADTQGTRRVLEIVEGDKIIFRASEEAAGTKKNFGAEERYIGTDQIAAKPWQVDTGKVPPALEKVVA